jgi:hypothetical protein
MFQYWMVQCHSTGVAMIDNDNTMLCTDITVLQNVVLTVKKIYYKITLLCLFL